MKYRNNRVDYIRSLPDIRNKGHTALPYFTNERGR